MLLSTPKTALQGWANENQVSPAEFGRRMGYTYNYAYQLLRGKAEVTSDMLGRFVVVYGAEAGQAIAAAFTACAVPNSAIPLRLPANSKSCKSIKRNVRKHRKTKRSTAIGTMSDTHSCGAPGISERGLANES